MHDRISLANSDGSLPELSEEGRLEALRIARLLVEQHGPNAPVKAAYRLYSLADLGEAHEYQLMLEAMKLLEQIRPEILVSFDA